MAGANDWRPEELEHLRRTVQTVLSNGGTKTQAFKQFSLENGTKSVEAARYKWISLCCMSEQEEPVIEHKHAQVRPQTESTSVISLKRKTRASKPEVSILELNTLIKNLNRVLHEVDQLRQELKNANRKIEKLQAENEALKNENIQFVQAFQLARKHIVSESRPSAVVKVSRNGIVESVSTGV
ncbi:MAG: hypothetical protein K6T83_00480 [Alicyclobacillus sp.]|nr:hypothetical protein [Alicyclobacillus sp.]